MLTTHEKAMMQDVERRLVEMRAHLSRELPAVEDTAAWYAFLADLKSIQGNSSNDVSFVATLLAKQYLARCFGVSNFDAAEKAQGAPGIDIDIRLPDGRRLVAEIKTTSPYMPNDLGAQQKATFEKDFIKLRNAVAELKLFLVTEPRTFELMKRLKYRLMLQGVTVVLLTTNEEFTA
ncbi:MAG: hypothetical protein QM730_15850 [Anaerolineales bacterium]